jgi:hypothetical protein
MKIKAIEIKEVRKNGWNDEVSAVLAVQLNEDAVTDVRFVYNSKDESFTHTFNDREVSQKIEAAQALGFSIDIDSLWHEKKDEVLQALEKQEQERKEAEELRRKAEKERDAENARKLVDRIKPVIDAKYTGVSVSSSTGQGFTLANKGSSITVYLEGGGKWVVDERRRIYPTGGRPYLVGDVTRRKDPTNKDLIAAAIRKLEAAIKRAAEEANGKLLKSLVEELKTSKPNKLKDWKFNYECTSATKTEKDITTVLTLKAIDGKARIVSRKITKVETVNEEL